MASTGSLAPPLDDRTAAQLAAVVGLVREVLGDDLLGAYLSGSAVNGGLRPSSDLDVVVVSAHETSPDDRRRLIGGLLPISGSRAAAGPARSIELTIAAASAVRPWRYPPPLDFQYGDWWRTEFERGDVAPWASPNPDLAILIASLLHDGRPVHGPPPNELLDPVPRSDLDRAMIEAIPGLLEELDDDTGNVVLTLARILATLETGAILPKDVAADLVLGRLALEHRPVLARARSIYLGEEPEDWDGLRAAVRPHADHVVAKVRAVAR